MTFDITFDKVIKGQYIHTPDLHISDNINICINTCIHVQICMYLHTYTVYQDWSHHLSVCIYTIHIWKNIPHRPYSCKCFNATSLSKGVFLSSSFFVFFFEVRRSHSTCLWSDETILVLSSCGTETERESTKKERIGEGEQHKGRERKREGGKEGERESFHALQSQRRWLRCDWIRTSQKRPTC